MAANGEVEIVEENEVEVDPEEDKVVEISEVHSAFEYDPEEIDYDPQEKDPEDQEESEEFEVQIKEEPESEEEAQSEEGYEQDRGTDGESERESPEASPPRQFVFRDTATGKRNRRRALRRKIRLNQVTKSAKQRLREGAAGKSHRRARTPSTELMSEEDEVTPFNHQKVSPRSTAKIERNNRNFLRVLRKSRSKVKIAEDADEVNEPSDSECDQEKQDNKVSRNEKHRRQ